MTAPGTYGPEPPTQPAGSPVYGPPPPGYGSPAPSGYGAPAVAGAPPAYGSPASGIGPGVPTTLTKPAPPAGPGVQPPFPAPPTEGDRRRVWIGLGVGGLALLLCCVGGVVAVVALGLTTVRALNEQATTTVSRYLDAVRAERYEDAYGLLCNRAQRAESPDEFATRVASLPKISSYTVHSPEVVDQVIVPVDLRLTGGGTESVQFVLEQDQQTGTLEVCDIS